MSDNPRILRVTTVPISLRFLVRGQMRFMMSQGYEVLACSADGKEVEDVKTYEGCEHTAVPFTRAITPIKDLVCLFQLYKLIRKFRPDIVHTHTPKAGLIGMMASRLAKVPLRLHTVAGMPLMEASGVKKRLLVLMERLTLACSTKVYPNSQGLMEYYKANISAKTNKLRVIGAGSSNGIDTSFFSKTTELTKQGLYIKNALAIPQNALVFIFVGRLVRDKGIHELIRAFVELQKSHDHIHLLLLGDQEEDLDPLDSDVIGVMEENPSIHLTGWQNDIRPYLSISDVLTFPSYREGFPNVPMQAGCFDLPSIVSNINGCNEIIVDGENGLIVQVKDQQALQQAMEQMIIDPSIISKLGINSRHLITSRYEQAVVWSEILKEYRQLRQEHV